MFILFVILANLLPPVTAAPSGASTFSVRSFTEALGALSPVALYSYEHGPRRQLQCQRELAHRRLRLPGRHQLRCCAASCGAKPPPCTQTASMASLKPWLPA